MQSARNATVLVFDPEEAQRRADDIRAVLTVYGKIESAAVEPEEFEVADEAVKRLVSLACSLDEK